MKSKLLLMTAVVSCLFWSSTVYGQEDPYPRDVTVAAIPGVIAAGAEWRQVWQGMDNADGMSATLDGSLLFAQEQPSVIRKLDANDYDSAYVKDTHGAGTVVVDPQGRVIVAQRTCTDPGRGDLPCDEPTKVSIVYPESERKVIVDNYQGEPLGRISGAIVDSKGTVYFDSGPPYYVKPGGQAVRIGDGIRSGGMILSPDERTLYIGSGGAILAFAIGPNGTVDNNGREFGKLLPGTGGNGMSVDAAGRVYVASGDVGVQVLSPQGEHLGAISTPRSIVDVAFAGPDKRTLYVVGRGALHPNGQEFELAPGYRNNGKTIYKIPMIAQGYLGRPR
jgi:gluconolactonase